MSDKIDLANKALPPHLLVNGISPLGRLYAVLSDGVHGLSDAECWIALAPQRSASLTLPVSSRLGKVCASSS
ncbi:hypothetical protein [Ramlibacter tataouinensis]|uniref:hypothetical protein n=1 Tax=Ramlibacter tataouinensis TaxID=94132 RepID=UPI0011AE564C|nr:hypothetical protein [Ramlibacter tataouinensis]